MSYDEQIITDFVASFTGEKISWIVYDFLFKTLCAECSENYAQRQLSFQNVQLTLREIIGEKPERKIEWPQLFRYLNGINILKKI